MRILIAEDDPTSRQILATVLRKDKHEVVEAVDGLQAWDCMQTESAPSLVILDWMMPKLDGPEVIRRIRTLPLSEPPYLILLTSLNKKADIINGLEVGANDYLTKPFDLGELRARVQVGLRLLSVQRALATKILELRQALEEVKTLRGILPICSSCKKIRDDQGAWLQVEEYVRGHSDAEFSHGICPDCVNTLYPGLNMPDAK